MKLQPLNVLSIYTLYIHAAKWYSNAYTYIYVRQKNFMLKFVSYSDGPAKVCKQGRDENKKTTLLKQDGGK